jgi:hypothetical protein
LPRSAPRAATVLYTVSATCAAIGALLWIRDQSTAPPRAYGDFLAADRYTPSTWRVWSQAVPEERLGLYLIAAALMLAVGARLISVRRG